MIARALCMFLIIGLYSCSNEKSEIRGVVTNIDYEHIGRNKYKQVVTYSYSFGGKVFESTSSFWFKWEGNYSDGDSIRIQVKKSNPLKSEIIEKLKEPKQVKVLKLKDKK